MGNPKPKVTWYKDGKAAPKLPTKDEGDTFTLTLIQPKAADSAQYTVKAVNEVGKCETTATLTVEGKFVITASAALLLPTMFGPAGTSVTDLMVSSQNSGEERRKWSSIIPRNLLWASCA